MAQPSKAGLKQRKILRGKKIELLPAEQQVRQLLEYGILAPSTHNSQPWSIRLKGGQVEIFADLRKKIPQADPTCRDLYMSIGAFLKNLELAARELNLTLDIEINNEPDGQYPDAKLILSHINHAKTPTESTMLDALIARQNFRGIFKPLADLKKVAEIVQAADGLRVSTQLFAEKPTILQLGELTAEGLKMGYSQPEFRKEISTYINHNLSRKRQGLHGYSLRMKLPASVILPKILKRKDLGPKLAMLNFRSFESASGVVVLSSLDDKRSWIETGRVLEDILVRLTEIGVASSIFAAAIEMGNLRSEVAKITKPKSGHKPQILFCVGEAADQLPFSVRKKLTSFLVK